MMRDLGQRRFSAARRLTNTAMTLIWSLSWPNPGDKGNKCLCAARLSHMVDRRTSSHQYQSQQCTGARMPVCGTERGHVVIPRWLILWNTETDFRTDFLETCHPAGAHVTLQPCPAACGIVPAATNLCLFSHFLLPLHVAWYRFLCTSTQRRHQC